jgi:hypothetical protein
VNVKTLQTVQTFTNDNAARSHPLAFANNLLYGYNTGLTAIQIWNASSGINIGYITGITSTAVMYMGISSGQAKNYLVYITTDSTMLVFDTSVTSKFPEQWQTNLYSGLVNPMRLCFSSDGTGYTQSLNVGLYVLDSFSNSHRLISVSGETSCYGIVSTPTNVYLGCGSRNIYMYRIISQQITYVTRITIVSSTGELRLSPDASKMYGALSNGAIGVWNVSAIDGLLMDGSKFFRSCTL